MSRYYSYLHSAVQILEQYTGEQPFAVFLKQFFSAHKKYGSTDRKQIGHLCYCYFRLGKALLSLNREERVLAGLFLCSNEPSALLAAIRPEWNNAVSLPLPEKWLLVASAADAISTVFPWRDELSNGIEHEKFCTSFLIQPDLFLRLRPGQESTVIEKLSANGITFNQLSGTCLSLPNASKVEQVIALNTEAVIQDYNSQRIGELFKETGAGPGMDVWDCCAASGGKSIMAKDILGDIDLTVSDIRESILVNLEKRFREAGIKSYTSFSADITKPGSLPASRFDLIICDVPCTGSGTWGRTPEQLFYFDQQTIETYAAKQKKIFSQAISCLRPGGSVVYSTCSVFKKENEEVVDFIAQQSALTVQRMELLKGYEQKADTLFAALLTRPL